MDWRKLIAGTLFSAVLAFVGWRMIHPPGYIDVSPWFATPIATLGAAEPSFDLSAQSCGACHEASAHEWQKTVHAHIWDDAAFHADWRHQGASQICLNCHTPLDRQQEPKVPGSDGGDSGRPDLVANPDFDPALRAEGVTCAACHVRDGKIFGPFATKDAPHPTVVWGNANETCIRCHLAANTSPLSFLSQPPCGTIAEVEVAQRPDPAAAPDRSGYATLHPVANPAALGCVECHMPAVERPLAPDMAPRASRRHEWKGGHDPATVRAALTAHFVRTGEGRYTLTLENTGANHAVPTGPADRRLIVTLKALDEAGTTVQAQEFVLERKVLGRPFLVDLADTRLQPHAPQNYSLVLPSGAKVATVEAIVRYGLMSPGHRDKIDFHEPITLEVFRERLSVGNS